MFRSALQPLLEELVAKYPAERIRVLADSRLAGGEGADVLFQVDEYDIRLVLLDAPEGKPALDLGKLDDLHRLLEDNPNTIALILTWTTDALLSVPLSTYRIHYLRQNPHRLPDLLARARPLRSVFGEILERQTRPWEIDMDAVAGSSNRAADTRQRYAAALAAAIEAERRRSYRSIERRAAADYFPVESEKRLILAALDDALKGARADELVPDLVHLPRRGSLPSPTGTSGHRAERRDGQARQSGGSLPSPTGRQARQSGGAK